MVDIKALGSKMELGMFIVEWITFRKYTTECGSIFFYYEINNLVQYLKSADS